MGQDIRELLKNNSFVEKDNEYLTPGHEMRFLDRLNESFPQPEKKSKIVLFNNTFSKYYVAASLVLIFLLGSYTFFDLQQNDFSTVLKQESNKSHLNLADVSPEFKKIEDYYLASINVELASLQVNSSNKKLLDTFMEQLSKLDEEYQLLQQDLKNEADLNIAIDALIQNLQLRLDLLQEFKEDLNTKNEQQNTTYQNLQA